MRHVANEIAIIDAKVEETVISLRPIDSVPFPAVILNTGGSIDPMGYVRHSGDIIKEDDFPEEGDNNRNIPILSFLLSPSDMQEFRDLIFYQVYKLLWQDVQTFLLHGNKNLLDMILKSGLVALGAKPQENQKDSSRVRFLEKYFADLSERPAVDLVEHFLALFCKSKWVYLNSPPVTQAEFGLRFLERRASKGMNILSRDNLDEIIEVRCNLLLLN